MTRYQHFENQVQSPMTSYSTAPQSNFAEYQMPGYSTAATNPNIAAYNWSMQRPGNTLGNGVISNPNYLNSVNNPNYNYNLNNINNPNYAYTNPNSVYTNPNSTYNNFNNFNNYGNNNQSAYWRQQQMQRLYQEEMMASLYYGATQPNYWGNPAYNYGLNNGINYPNDLAYQYGTNYGNNYLPDSSYYQGGRIPNFSNGQTFDVNGNPIYANVNGAGYEVDPRYAGDPRYAAGNPGYVDPRYAGADPRYAGVDPRYAGVDPRYAGADPRYAGGDPRYGDPNYSTGADYLVPGANGRMVRGPIPQQQDGAIYRPVPGGDPGYDQGQGRGRAPQGDGTCPDLTETSFDGGPTPDAGRRRGDGRRGGSERFATGDGLAHAAVGGAAWSQYDFQVYNHLLEQAKALQGHSIHEVDKGIPVRLGCARAVALLVDRGYGFKDVTQQNIHSLEQQLRKDGFREVSISDMQPGDVICGYRAPTDYPHGAVYLGNGMIFNNDSNEGVMDIQSIKKYNTSDFKRFVILRRPATVPAVAGGDQQATS